MYWVGMVRDHVLILRAGMNTEGENRICVRVWY